MSGDLILEVAGLRKSFGPVAAVRDVSFEVREREVLALLGPSGCGKSTTLRLIAGLEAPTDGEIRIRKRTVAAPARGVFVASDKRNLGLVFQSYAIWPHMTVAGNVAFPLEVRREPAAEIRRRVGAVLDLVGLGDLASRRATELSGGQQQRVALARALVYEPDLLLLDEPLSNLDAKLRTEMRVQLKILQRRIGMTILYVTHDQVEAMSLADRVAVMRDGNIEQLGTPHDIYERPATYFVQSFVGRVLTLPATAETRDGLTRFRLASGEEGLFRGLDDRVTGSVRLAIRPEDVSVERCTDRPPENAFRGIVEEIIYCGDHVECLVKLGTEELTCDIGKDLDVRPGEPVALVMSPRRLKAWAD